MNNSNNKQSTSQPNKNQNQAPRRRLLTLREVSSEYGVNKAFVYRMMGEGKFPRSVKIGDNSVRWVADEIEAWYQAKLSEREVSA